MTYREEIKDLFSVSDDYYLAHCISADFGMGKGIVIYFNKKFDMKRKLQANIQTISMNGTEVSVSEIVFLKVEY